MTTIFAPAEARVNASNCPICGSASIAGDPCHPQCDPGALHRRGIDIPPIGNEFYRLTPFSSRSDYEE
jgi:hypothetical protein